MVRMSGVVMNTMRGMIHAAVHRVHVVACITVGVVVVSPGSAAVVTVLSFVPLVVLLIALALIWRAVTLSTGIVIAGAHWGWAASVNGTIGFVLQAVCMPFAGIVVMVFIR